MNLEYKRATIDNLKEVQEINIKLFQNQYDYDSDLILEWPLTNEGEVYFKDVIENGAVYLAYDNGKTVGYLAGTYDKGNPYLNKKIAEVNNLYVDNECRNKNIGSKLVDIFKKDCNARGIYSYDVSVYCENLKGIKFWEKNGFNRKVEISLACDEV